MGVSRIGWQWVLKYTLPVFVSSVVPSAGCSHGGRDGIDDGPGKRDMRGASGAEDLRRPSQDGGDDGVRDLAGADLSLPILDLSAALDFASPPDLTMPPADMSSPRPGCKNGVGWAAFRFKYDGSTSSRLEAFGLPDSSNWEAVVVRSTSFTDALHGGGVEIASGNWILIRFSLVGLSVIRSAKLSVYGSSYSTGASGSINAWSPIYGDNASPTNSFSNAWPYTWNSVDYTRSLGIGDSKDLTGIRLYAGPGSNDLVINTVELCLDAS
jgi:hypothetical protein